jgi:phage tail-like protein
MDANGLNFWMLSQAQDWPLPSPSTLEYCAGNQRLRLRGVRLGPAPQEDFNIARNLAEAAPMARDTFGNYARVSDDGKQILAGGSGPGEVPIFDLPAGQQATDLAMGADGILYIAAGGKLILVDRQDRWPPDTLPDATFNFWRLAALPEGGVLALDRSVPRLACVTGAPLQTGGPVDQPAPGLLRSCIQNPDPPQIAAVFPLPAGETFVAVAAIGHRVVLLSWAAAALTNTASFVRLFDPKAGLGNPAPLDGIRWPYSITSLEDLRIAVLVTGLNEALAYDLSEAGNPLVAGGDSLILTGDNRGPFAHTPGQPPYYADGARLIPLVPLSLNSLAASGATDPTAPKIIDSGKPHTVWHRAFVEAVLPPRCSVVVWLAAADQPAALTSPAAEWYPHVFGDADLSTLPGETPQAVRLSIPSEAPFAQPLLTASTSTAKRQGLFMALIQRAGRAVRNLTGRFLGIRVELHGDRRSTPEVAALRVWGSRFSYVKNYLPEIYRENRFGPDADRAGAATRRDFFERFVGIFEAQLTRIEDRVANSYLLTRPETAPDEALDWLGAWIGLDFNGYPQDRRRARLLASASLYKQRGTVQGIVRELDIATNGLCSRGAIIAIEDFRLRHIFATILGANLAIENDPLLPGHSPGSNSYVGNTLFIGDASEQGEILSLFSSLLPETTGERAAVQQFFDSLANRITVFIHNQVESIDLTLVRDIVEAEKPAHVAAAYRTASQPFMVGLAGLLGVDSYLAREPRRDPVVVNASRIGRYNIVRQAPSLDPRLEI